MSSACCLLRSTKRRGDNAASLYWRLWYWKRIEARLKAAKDGEIKKPRDGVVCALDKIKASFNLQELG